MARILFTGATGYLGSHLLEGLLQYPPHHEITILLRPNSNTNRIAHVLDRVRCITLDDKDLEVLFTYAGFEGLIHGATDYGRDGSSQDELYQTNVRWPQTLVHSAIERGLQWVCNLDTMLDPRISTYAWTKGEFRRYLREISNTIQVSNVRMEHFFGPGDHPRKFITYLIHAFLDRIPSLPLTMGFQQRDFMYIEDTRLALQTIIEHRVQLPQLGFFEYQLGSGQSRPIREVVQLVQSLCGNTQTELQFGAIPDRPFEASNLPVSLEALTALGWSSQWDLRTGLEQTICYEREQRL